MQNARASTHNFHAIIEPIICNIHGLNTKFPCYHRVNILQNARASTHNFHAITEPIIYKMHGPQHTNFFLSQSQYFTKCTGLYTQISFYHRANNLQNARASTHKFHSITEPIICKMHGPLHTNFHTITKSIICKMHASQHTMSMLSPSQYFAKCTRLNTQFPCYHRANNLQKCTITNASYCLTPRGGILRFPWRSRGAGNLQST